MQANSYNKPTRKRWAYIAFILFHLVVIGTGIFHLSSRLRPPFGKIAALYQALTGAGSSFGFFSPNIGNQFVVHFEVSPDHPEPLRLDDFVANDTSLRIGNMYRFFIRSYANEKLKRSIAASLSARVFARFPKAKSVAFVAEFYQFPNLKQYAEGQRPSRVEVYRANFKYSNGDAYGKN